MATEIVWYEVIDMTSVGMKYPNDWFKRAGYNHKNYDNPAFDILGRFSTEEKAEKCLQKWAAEKGIDYAENLYVNIINGLAEYYEQDYSVCCKIIKEVGLYYNILNEQIDRITAYSDICYQTSAMLVKKTMILDEES
ncbi:MAG: hypothetical protein K5776_09080 [Lachnospiraceae bacterium]|nr:hypothetical protein [Lachnospiraceae bacterium]